MAHCVALSLSKSYDARKAVLETFFSSGKLCKLIENLQLSGFLSLLSYLPSVINNSTELKQNFLCVMTCPYTKTRRTAGINVAIKPMLARCTSELPHSFELGCTCVFWVATTCQIECVIKTTCVVSLLILNVKYLILVTYLSWWVSEICLVRRGVEINRSFNR